MNEHDPLIKYESLRDTVNSLIQQYNHLMENNTCKCGFQIFDDGHKKGCVKPKEVKKATYRKIAITLRDILLAEREARDFLGKI